MSNESLVEPVNPLWRYMSFSKFVSLLSQSSIYFRRADGFADKWEGAISSLEERDQYQSNVGDLMKTMINSGKISSRLPDEEKEKAVFDLADQLNDLNRRLRLNTFISCWHESTHESEAMWKLYSYDDSEGIAIMTTPDLMKSLLPIGEGIEMHRVIYRDYTAEVKNAMLLYLYKRHAFQHEREARLIYTELAKEPDGKMGRLFPLDVNQLIEKIVISPYASPYIYDLVVDVCDKYSVDVPIERSQLNQEPFHC